jgi:hypothetical protein
VCLAGHRSAGASQHDGRLLHTEVEHETQRDDRPLLCCELIDRGLQHDAVVDEEITLFAVRWLRP